MPTLAAAMGCVRTGQAVSNVGVWTGGTAPPVTCHPIPATGIDARTVLPACLAPIRTCAPVRRGSEAARVRMKYVSHQNLHYYLNT